MQFEKILAKAVKVDKTLEGAVQAEQKRFMNGSEKLEKRIRKAEERKMATEISQLAVLKEKLFPKGTPQERIENFLNSSLGNPYFLSQVGEIFDPLDFSFYLMVESWVICHCELFSEVICMTEKEISKTFASTLIDYFAEKLAMTAL